VIACAVAQRIFHHEEHEEHQGITKAVASRAASSFLVIFVILVVNLSRR